MSRKEKKPLPGAQWRRVQNKKLMYTVYFVLRLMVILVLAAQVLNGNYQNAFLCALTLVLFTLPSFFERRLRVDLPDALEIIILLFIFAAEILGEIRAFYVIFPRWDDTLHTLNGFLCAAIGFCLVDLLNRQKTVSSRLSPLYMAVVAFCFSMTVGVVWEFFEFSMDQLTLVDMQKDTILSTISTVNLDPAGGTAAVVVEGIRDVVLVLEDGSQLPLGLGGYLDIGIVDTMHDLWVNFIGAVVFSTLGFFYVKYRGQGKGKMASQFIPRVYTDDDGDDDDGESHETGQKEE